MSTTCEGSIGHKGLFSVTSLLSVPSESPVIVEGEMDKIRNRNTTDKTEIFFFNVFFTSCVLVLVSCNCSLSALHLGLGGDTPPKQLASV